MILLRQTDAARVLTWRQVKAGSCLLHHGAMPHRSLPNTSAAPRRSVAIHYIAAEATTRSESRLREPAANMPTVRGGEVTPARL